MKINVSSWNDFYNKESLKKEAIGEKYFKKLKNSLNIYAFGEYDTLCVKSWRNQFVDRLIESKFKIRECLILNRFSYSANSIFSSSLEGFNFKTFYTRRQRKDKKRELSYRGFTKEEVREASRKKITFKRRK